jgi:aryl-alcohol dehydrogenase-like predicted oxidoreductase
LIVHADLKQRPPQRLFPPLGVELARVVLGSLGFATAKQGSVFELLDAWADIEGGVLDTAAMYGAGDAERAIGRWLKRSGKRDRATLLVKGGYPGTDGQRRIRPELLRADLTSSLERLGTDHVDIFMPHTDDPEVPVGEIVDCLHEFVVAGLARSVGASNWTPARLGEALAYCIANARMPLTSSSVQWSLAERVLPYLPGNTGARDEAVAHWYAQTGFPVFAWSSLAAGYFGDGAELSTPARANAYESAVNAERRRRAGELAHRLGRPRVQVALAWVLNQPSEPFAVVGSSTLEHLVELWGASKIKLDPDELSWLDAG